MAQSSPQKLPRGKAETYSTVPLSDTAAVTPLLLDLSIATCNPSVEDDVVTEAVSQAPEVENNNGDGMFTVSTRMSCTCCSVVFTHRTEQKAHFKSDWHRYNLKQQLRGKACISEDQFEAMTGEVSSISGSDDTSTSSADEENGAKPTAISARLKRLQVCDNTDMTDSEGEDNSAIMAATRKHPKVFLRNGSGQLISMYRCVLYHKKSSPNTPAELVSLAEQAKTYTRVAMVMLAGGHFSAAVFDGTGVVVHKTFHRYVVRAKRGTLQSVRDNQGGAPKSGGASLRRYNEAALAREIQELLAGWSQHLQSCHLIFLRTSTYSRHIFFGAKSPVFSKDDTRVRTIPFTTGRPTFNEAKRVHLMLMSVECFGDESMVTSFVPVSPPRHLHPNTGQLVVRPDPSPSRRNKVKDRNVKGDVDTVEGEERQVAGLEEEGDNNQSDVEVELVEVREEIQTDHLQEFACSMGGAPRRNKKRKKKGGQKGPDKEAASPQQAAANSVDGEQLSEEETQMKNRLYTCCKAGDVTQLSQLLDQLTGRDGASHRPSSVDHQQQQQQQQQQQHVMTVTDNGRPDDFSQNASPHHHPPQHTHPHSPDSQQDMRRTSAIAGDGESDRDSTEQRGETDSLQERSGTTSHDHNPTQRRNESDSSQERWDSTNSDQTPTPQSCTSTPNTEQPVISQSVTGCGTDTSQTHPPGTDPSRDGGAIRRGRFERVVLGRYGERGFSLLHVASSSGQGDIITALLAAGCDPCVRDKSGKTPYSVAGTKDVRNAFRRFRGNHPDHYDYDAAQIPSALTAEQEAERKLREAEKRKLQKKAKQERLKERKAEEAKAMQEQKERVRFLALSDREKRALAAERRLLAQASEQAVKSVLNRCFQCGVDISGKVPFEYQQFQFCSPRCLKEHRMKGAK
ncbi:tRNA endonuclease ANKZF1-like isoform X2 [Babylonia areolata]